MKYKLKVGARQFFNSKYHRYIETIKFWKGIGIPVELLDEVDVVYIELGHEHTLSGGTKSSSLSGWNCKNGGEAHFHFTIKVRGVENSEYDKVNIPVLMDKMQKTCNDFFKATRF